MSAVLCAYVCVCVLLGVSGFWLSVLLVKLVWVIYMYNEVFVVAFVKCILFLFFFIGFGIKQVYEFEYNAIAFNLHHTLRTLHSTFHYRPHH